MSGLKKNIFYTFITQFPTQILGIITGIFITRMLGPEGRGIYTMFITDVELCVTIFGFSLTNAVIYYFATGGIPKNKVYGASLLLTLLSTLLFILTTVIILFTGFKRYFFPADYTTFLMIGWFFGATFITLVSTILGAIFQGYREFGIVNKVAIINSVFNVSVFGLLFLAHKTGGLIIRPETVLLLYLLALLVNLGCWYFYLFRKHSELSPDFTVSVKNDLTPMLRYLGLNHLSNIINFLNYRFSYWIVASYLNVAQLGYFGLASGIAGMLNLISVPISTVILPYLSMEDTFSRRAIFARYARLNFTIIILGGLAGFVLAPILIPFVYGQEFIPSIPIFQISLVGVLFVAQNKLMGSFNMANNKQMINLIGTIIALILTISLNFLLVPRYGTEGAAFCNVIAFLAMFLFYYANYLMESKGGINIFIFTREDNIYFRSPHENQPPRN